MANYETLYPTMDAEIGNHSKNNWFIIQDGKSTGSYIGCWDWPDTHNWEGHYGYQGRALFKYGELPALPPGSVIIKATLKMYLSAQGKTLSDYNDDYWVETPNPTIDIHRITSEWEEGSGDGQTYTRSIQNSGANWSRRTSNRYWSSNGGDFDSVPAASQTISYTSQWVEFDITELYKQWVSETHPNYGVIVKYRDDHNAQGGFYTWTKEYFENHDSWHWTPQITVEYNEPPEPPRALVPNNESIVGMRHSGPIKFDWDFVDYAPETVGGKADYVFMLDGSGSFSNDKDEFMNYLEAFLDRLDVEEADYRMMIIDHRGDTLQQYGWYTERNEFWNQVDGYNPSGGDYSPTHNVFLDEAKGAKSLMPAFREDAEVHLVFVTDEGLKSSNNTYKQEVSDWAIANNYKIWTIIHGCFLHQFAGFSEPTDGRNLNLHSQWNSMIDIPSKRIVVGDLVTGDVQTKAEVRIWKIESDDTRTFIGTFTAGDKTRYDLDLHAENVTLETHGLYEWDVTVYDTSNLSATSEKATFVYRPDMQSYDVEIEWPPLPKPGDIILRSHIYGLKEVIKNVSAGFMNVKQSKVDSLFTGDIVPSVKDTKLMKEILVQMIEDSNLPVKNWWTRDFVNDGLLDPGDIQYIRSIIDVIHNTGPAAPGETTARRVTNYLSPPSSVTASNGGLYSSDFTISWVAPKKHDGGWIIETSPSASKDILFYRVYHNYTRDVRKQIKALNYIFASQERSYTEYDFTPQQYEDGNSFIGTNERQLFITGDGASSHDEILVKAVDTSMQYSTSTKATIDRNVDDVDMGDVMYYVVEYQVREIDATQSDPNGEWTLADMLVTEENLSLSLRTSGSVWFRVSAITTNLELTDHAYTSEGVKVQL